MRKLAVGGVTSVITIVLLQAGCAAPTTQKAPDSPAGSAFPTATDPPAVAASSAAGKRSQLRHPPRSRHAHHHHRHATANATPTMLASPWCTAVASYNAQYDAYAVSVSSNQLNQIGTATASDGQSQTYSTDASGHAYVNVHGDDNGGHIAIMLRVGAATCLATV
jgi:hypothetical protein